MGVLRFFHLDKLLSKCDFWSRSTKYEEMLLPKDSNDLKISTTITPAITTLMVVTVIIMTRVTIITTIITTITLTTTLVKLDYHQFSIFWVVKQRLKKKS